MSHSQEPSLAVGDDIRIPGRWVPLRHEPETLEGITVTAAARDTESGETFNAEVQVADDKLTLIVFFPRATTAQWKVGALMQMDLKYVVNGLQRHEDPYEFRCHQPITP